MGCKVSKADNRTPLRRAWTEAPPATLRKRSISTDCSSDATPTGGHVAARFFFDEKSVVPTPMHSKPPLMPKQCDYALLRQLHNFQGATFTLGRPPRVSIIAFVVLIFSEDTSSKVIAIDEFPFIEVQSDQIEQFEWVHAEWKELVKIVQTQIGGRTLHRGKKAETLAAIRAVPDSHAREFIKDCLKTSELVSDCGMLGNLRRVARLVADEEVSDQLFVKELEWTGALNILTNLA